MVSTQLGNVKVSNTDLLKDFNRSFNSCNLETYSACTSLGCTCNCKHISQRIALSLRFFLPK